ncbi:MAG: hypothetical protein Q8Q85_08610 [Gemmatimonadales bacterium]|nr:hypothetical protein [Gemmatimonadales bacterium]
MAIPSDPRDYLAQRLDGARDLSLGASRAYRALPSTAWSNAADTGVAGGVSAAF